MKLILLLLILIFPIWAKTGSDTFLFPLRDAVYNYQPIAMIRQLYLSAHQHIKKSSPENNEKKYWYSRIEFLVAKGEFQVKNYSQAKRHYEKALFYIDQSLSMKEYSEGYRMKSEIIAQLCILHLKHYKIWYVLQNGSKVKHYAEKALAFDPENGKAHIIIAALRIYPPRFYGADPQKGIALMFKALQKPNIEQDDLYKIYLGIATAYSKMKKTQRAKLFLEKAIALYPSNQYLKQEYKQIT